MQHRLQAALTGGQPPLLCWASVFSAWFLPGKTWSHCISYCYCKRPRLNLNCIHQDVNFSNLVQKLNHSQLSLRWMTRCYITPQVTVFRLRPYWILCPFTMRSRYRMVYTCIAVFPFQARLTYFPHLTLCEPHRGIHSPIAMAETRRQGALAKSHLDIFSAKCDRTTINLRVTMRPLHCSRTQF